MGVPLFLALPFFPCCCAHVVYGFIVLTSHTKTAGNADDAWQPPPHPCVLYNIYVWRTQPIGSSLRGHRATLSYDLIWPPPPPRKTSFGDLALQPNRAPHPTTTILQPKRKLGGGGSWFSKLTSRRQLCHSQSLCEEGGPGSHFDVPSPRFPIFSFSPPEFIRIVEWGHTQAGGGGGGGGK